MAGDSDDTTAIPFADIRYLADRIAIRDVLSRYTRGLDRQDAEILTSAFWPDAQLNYGSHFSGLPHAFLDWVNERLVKAYVYIEHHVTNQTVDIEGDIAHVESYIFYILRTADNKEIGGSGRYIDVMERRNGEWRISLRETLSGTRFALDSTYSESDTPEFTKGAGKSDLSYMRPLLPRKT